MIASRIVPAVKSGIVGIVLIAAVALTYVYTYGSGKVAGFNEGIQSAIEHGVASE